MVASALSAEALDRGRIIKLISQGSKQLQQMQHEYETYKNNNIGKEYARNLKKSINQEQRRSRQHEQDIRQLLDRVMSTKNINSRDKQGRTLLMLVAEHGLDDVTEMVLAKNPDLSIADNNNRLAIDYEKENNGTLITTIVKQKWEAALASADHKAIAEALSYGADPNWGSENKTALEVAILAKSNDLIGLLIMSGADPEKKCSEGILPIELALRENNTQAAVSIIGELKETEITLSDGCPLLQRLIQNKNPETINALLLKMSADGKDENTDGTSYLCMVIRLAAPECTMSVIENNKGQLNREDSEGNLPLHEAARRGNTALYRKMIELGASPTQKNARGETVLMHAALSANSELLAEVLNNISPEILQAKDTEGHTALYYAQLAQDKAAAQALKDAGLQSKK